MSNDSSFSILSTNAALVEVSGDGPIVIVPSGVTVADSARTTVAVDLRATPVRRFRVDAPGTVQTAIIVDDSPCGAFVGVRRCVAPARPAKWWRLLGVDRWPRLRATLKHRAPSALALWYLLTDDVQPCTWRDVGDNNTNQVTARGGDLVVVSLVNP
jgi:hypothetical protein